MTKIPLGPPVSRGTEGDLLVVRIANVRFKRFCIGELVGLVGK